MNNVVPEIYRGEQEQAPRPEKTKERFWRILWNAKGKLIALNILFLICCIPIVTVGPAAAALTEVVKDIVNERIVFPASDFFKAMKKHWRQSLPIGLIRVLVILADMLAIWYYLAGMAQNHQNLVLVSIGMVVAVLVGVVILLSGFYLYQLVVGCELKTSVAAKNAILLALAELKANLITLLYVAAVFALVLLPTLFISVWYYPISLLLFALIGVAVPAFIVAFRLQKYIAAYVTDPYYRQQDATANEQTE